MADAAEGKAAAKAELRARVGLSDADAPLVAVVTRLTHQKGIHLIKHAAWRTLERGGQWLLLGSAPDPRVQVRGWVCVGRLPESCDPGSLCTSHSFPCFLIAPEQVQISPPLPRASLA